MKTLFITVFEGVESKNILRTSIFSTLLEDPDTRIVLLTKSQERLDYHKKEFHDPRISYETVEIPKPSGWDALFIRLKFLLLRTDTTLLRQRMMREAGGNAVGHWLGLWASWLLARRSVRRAVRFLDSMLVRNNSYAACFETYRPDCVLAANLFDEPEVHLIREAKKRGICTIGLINSWDKPTARCMIRMLPDRCIVFNDEVKEDLIAYHDVKPEAIFVGGIPQYDQYIHAVPRSRNDFFDSIHASPSQPLIVYSPIGSTFSDSDWDIIDLLHSLNREHAFGREVTILVRFPPNEFIDRAELGKRPFLRYDYPGVRFSRVRGIDWEMTFSELAHLTDTLYHMALLICYASSISVDAALFDRPVININFEVRRHEILGKSPTQFYQMKHYKKALSSGGIRLVGSTEELIVWVKKYLEHPELDREGRSMLVRQQCAFTDGKSGERIGKFILRCLNEGVNRVTI